MRKIDTFEIVAMLFISRAAQILISDVMPDGKFTATVLAGLALGLIINVALAVPLLMYMRAGGKTNRAVSAVMWALFLWSAIGGTIDFTKFVGVSAYGGSELVVLLLLTSAVAYAVKLGIEPLSRFSVIVLFVFVASMLLLTAGVVGRADMGALMEQKLLLSGAVETAVKYVLRPDELVALMFLLAFQKGRGRTAFFSYSVLSAAFCGLVALGVSLVLGAYGTTQQYPVYALTTVAGVWILQRLDSVFLVIWILTSFIRVSLYAWLASAAFTVVFGWNRRAAITANVTALAAVSLAAVITDADMAAAGYLAGVAGLAAILIWPAVNNARAGNVK